MRRIRTMSSKVRSTSIPCLCICILTMRTSNMYASTLPTNPVGGGSDQLPYRHLLPASHFGEMYEPLSPSSVRPTTALSPQSLRVFLPALVYAPSAFCCHGCLIYKFCLYVLILVALLVFVLYWRRKPSPTVAPFRPIRSFTVFDYYYSYKDEDDKE